MVRLILRIPRVRPASVALHLLAAILFAVLMLCVVDPAFITRPLELRVGATAALAVAFLAAVWSSPRD